jgi:hypothetical protein
MASSSSPPPRIQRVVTEPTVEESIALPAFLRHKDLTGDSRLWPRNHRSSTTRSTLVPRSFTATRHHPRPHIRPSSAILLRPAAAAMEDHSPPLYGAPCVVSPSGLTVGSPKMAGHRRHRRRLGACLPCFWGKWTPKSIEMSSQGTLGVGRGIYTNHVDLVVT